MAPYMQLRRDRVWLIAAVGLAGFLTSALVGYLIGALLFAAIAGRTAGKWRTFAPK